MSGFRPGRPFFRLTLALMIAPLALAEARTASREPAVIKTVPPLSDRALQVVKSSLRGGRGSDLMPMIPTPVQLRTAEIRLQELPEHDAWQVNADYELVNDGKQPVKLPLVLVEEACLPGGGHTCAPLRGAYLSLLVTAADKPVEAAPAPPAALSEWSATPGKGALYQITVPPKKPLHVVESYRFERGRGTEWWGLSYLSTAGRFAFAIDKVRITVEVRQPVAQVVYPRVYTLQKFTEQPGDETKEGRAPAITRLIFTADKLGGRADFLAAFPVPAIAGLSPAGFCSGFQGTLPAAELALAVRGYDLARLRACQNQVLSLHGYPFKEPALRTLYYGTPPRLPDWADETTFAIAAHPENPAYKDTLLSPGERTYINALSEAERQARR